MDYIWRDKIKFSLNWKFYLDLFHNYVMLVCMLLMTYNVLIYVLEIRAVKKHFNNFGVRLHVWSIVQWSQNNMSKNLSDLF